MPKMVKEIYGGGIIAKNVKLQVFLEPKTYLEIIQEAKNYNIIARNDSELVRKILILFFQELPMKTIEIEQLKKANENKKAILEVLNTTINDLKSKKKKGKVLKK